MGGGDRGKVEVGRSVEVSAVGRFEGRPDRDDGGWFLAGFKVDLRGGDAEEIGGEGIEITVSEARFVVR